MFIDYAELCALNRQVMTMKAWIEKVEQFLSFNGQQRLQNAGQVSHEVAVAKSHAEHEKFRVKQDQEYLSDFDTELVRYLKGRDK